MAGEGWGTVGASLTMSVESAPQRGPLSLTEVVARHGVIARAEKARLAWLHVHALDDIQEQRIEFDREINVILGKNGVGKTTLLNLLSFVLRWDFSPWNQRSFDVEYQFELGPWFWHVRVKNTRDRALDRDGVAGYRPEVNLHARYEEFELHAASDRSGYQRVINGEERRFESVGLSPFWLFAVRMDDEWANTVSTVSNACPKDLDPVRLDEGIDAFRLFTSGVSETRPLVLSRQHSDSERWWYNCTASSLLGRMLMSVHPAQVMENPTLPVRLSLEQLGISQPILEALGASDIFADLGLPEVRGSEEETTLTLSQLVFWMKRANGDVLRHTSWSWGQQRLVAFALYLAANKDYVVADELVNGMHHEWIELCLREIGDRQCFLTSQNPILVDYTDLVSVEQIQRAFVLCAVRETKPGQTARTWRNMTEKEAAELWEARTNGFESTSEVMRNRGWW